MAATTFTELAEIAGSAYDQTMIEHQFLKSDPLLRNLMLEMTDGTGKDFSQQMLDSPDTAVMAGWQDDFANTAIAYSAYSSFLNRITDQKPIDAVVGSVMNSANGLPTQVELHRRQTIQAVVRKFRSDYMVANPADVVIGADLTTTGITAVEMGPRSVSSTDTHGTKATPTERRHSIKWVATGNLMSYQPYGETSYGPAVEFTATKYHRVPLFNADGTKWIYVTGVYATLNAAANLTPADTDATTIQVTPNLDMTGFLTLAHPTYRRFGNLSTDNPGATTGDAPSRSALSWLSRTVRDSGTDGTGAIVCDPDMYQYLENMMVALGLGEQVITFMGEQLNALSIAGVPIFYSNSMTETRLAPDGSTSVGRIMGVRYGGSRSGAHIRYNSVASLVDYMPEFNSGGLVDSGYRNDPIAMPWTFYVVPPNSTSEKLYPRASMLVEPSAARFDSIAFLDNIKYA
jgi:hypothetical protein